MKRSTHDAGLDPLQAMTGEDSRSFRYAGAMARVTVAEAIAVLCVTAAAFVLRVWNFARLGINHFDEGVYVFSALGLADASQPLTLFPNQQRFSPPFYFTAVSLLHRLTGWPVDLAALALNVGFGTATVVLVWWVGRRWYGPRAGLAAAVLLALCQSHILMSRVALTDAAFSFLFVLTIAFLVEAVERQSLRWAVLAGLAGGLVWNTKYHGWFTLLITGAAFVPAIWMARLRLRELRRPLLAWLLGGAIAILLYLPWALFIRTSEGYRQIANYYLTLISTQWFTNLVRHVQQQLYLEGPASRAALLVALALVLGWNTSAHWSKTMLLVAAAAAASLVLGFFGSVSILAFLAVPALVRGFDLYRNRVALAWLGLWVVAAPVYHPYARLLLPYTIITCLLAGAWLASNATVAGRSQHAADLAVERKRARSSSMGPVPGERIAGWPGASFTVVLLAAFVIAFGSWRWRPGGNLWRSSRELADVAARIAEHVPAGQDVFVLGEPALAYYVHVSGRPSFRRVALADLDTLQNAGYLATGVYTDRAPVLARGISERARRLTRLGSFPFRPNDLRLLDDFRPDRARAFLTAPDTTFDITLYRLSPAR
ncbi:MAG: ArnT family glycosyltransferase [Longimicrobiales bacterium]